jgi:Trk-type K+ transport system membrane component
MWIGASPGSTGGGIKTTTFAVAVLTLFNQLRGRDKIYIFGRQAAEESISRAFMVIFTSIIFVTIGAIIFVIIEPNKDPLNVFYECFSAMGTVGLSRNLTFFIGDGAKVILILLMYIGRIGTFTFLLAFNKPAAELRYTLPKEMINIG